MASPTRSIGRTVQWSRAPDASPLGGILIPAVKMQFAEDTAHRVLWQHCAVWLSFASAHAQLLIYELMSTEMRAEKFAPAPSDELEDQLIPGSISGCRIEFAPCSSCSSCAGGLFISVQSRTSTIKRFSGDGCPCSCSAIFF